MCVLDQLSKQASWKHTYLESEIMLSGVIGLERATSLCYWQRYHIAQTKEKVCRETEVR